MVLITEGRNCPGGTIVRLRFEGEDQNAYLYITLAKNPAQVIRSLCKTALL